jgi:hypothetical protein
MTSPAADGEDSDLHRLRGDGLQAMTVGTHQDAAGPGRRDVGRIEHG